MENCNWYGKQQKHYQLQPGGKDYRPANISLTFVLALHLVKITVAQCAFWHDSYKLITAVDVACASYLSGDFCICRTPMQMVFTTQMKSTAGLQILKGCLITCRGCKEATSFFLIHHFLTSQLLHRGFALWPLLLSIHTGRRWMVWLASQCSGSDVNPRPQDHPWVWPTMEQCIWAQASNLSRDFHNYVRSLPSSYLWSNVGNNTHISLALVLTLEHSSFGFAFRHLPRMHRIIGKFINFWNYMIHLLNGVTTSLIRKVGITETFVCPVYHSQYKVATSIKALLWSLDEMATLVIKNETCVTRYEILPSTHLRDIQRSLPAPFASHKNFATSSHLQFQSISDNR